jgi:creatinine amidohydrolase
MREVRWERMFPDELEAAMAACPVVYFAYGLCEPHGPQSAVGLDALKAHAICCAAARQHGGIVAPRDYWHVHEIGPYASWAATNVGERRPWLTAVPPWIHFKNICYHVRAADALGFHAAVLFTGHSGPNWHDLKTLVEILQPHVAMRLCGLPDFEANQPGFDNDNHSGGDHAGKVETSLLWAAEPDCVDISRLPDAQAPGPHFAMGADARLSNRLTGQRMIADQVRFLGQKQRELLDQYAATPPRTPSHRPLSFADVERIWTDEIEPKLPDFQSMQYLGRTPPPAGSRWLLNHEIPARPGNGGAG